MLHSHFYRPANLLICTDSKQSLRPLSFLSRTGTVLQAFLCANIQDSTFHQADCCGRLQTVRPPAECRLSDTKTWKVPFQTTDRKPSRLPFRLQRENISMLSFNKRMFHIPPAKREALHSLEPKACWARTKSCPCWLLVYWIEIRMDFL